MEVIRFQPSDSSGVASFMDKYFRRRPHAATRRASDSEHYSWKYGGNCFGSTIAFLYRPDREVLGGFAAVPKRIQVRDREVPAFEVLEAFVAPECQGKGVYTALSEAVYAEIEKTTSFIYGVAPTPRNFPILTKKYGFYHAFSCRNLILILNFRNGLSSIGMPSGISKVLGPPSDALIRLISKMRRSSRDIDDIREIKSFPADFDDFLNQIRTGYDFAVVKKREYLEWRYVTCPEPYRLFECRLKNGETGYLVCKVGTWRTSRIGYIVDVLADAKNREMRSMLVGAMIHIMRKEEVDIVSIDLHRGSPMYGELIRCGFIPRVTSIPFIVRQTTYDFLSPGASGFNPGKWLLMPGDGDFI